MKLTVVSENATQATIKCSTCHRSMSVVFLCPYIISSMARGRQLWPGRPAPPPPITYSNTTSTRTRRRRPTCTRECPTPPSSRATRASSRWRSIPNRWTWPTTPPTTSPTTRPTTLLDPGVVSIHNGDVCEVWEKATHNFSFNTDSSKTDSEKTMKKPNVFN